MAIMGENGSYQSMLGLYVRGLGFHESGFKKVALTDASVLLVSHCRQMGLT